MSFTTKNLKITRTQEFIFIFNNNINIHKSAVVIITKK